MISGLTIFSVLLGGLLCLVVPIIIFLVIRKKANRLAMPLLAGVIGFFVMQLVIRIPILGVISAMDWYKNMSLFALAVFLGTTASLFETVGRWATMKLFMRKDTRFYAGFAHGIGHGGIEAVLLVGLNFFIYGVMGIALNAGASLPTGLDVIRDVLIDTPWYEFLVGTAERMMTIVFHICLSILTVYAIKKKQFRYIVLVLFLHALTDFTVVMLAGNGVNMFIIELVVLLFVIMTVIIIKFVHDDYIKSIPFIEEEVAHD